MGYLLRMSGEIHDWLTELRASDPPVARRVGEALTALLDEGAALGPPLVGAPAADPPPAGSQTEPPLDAYLPDALDRSYQRRLDGMQIIRWRVADAATATSRVQTQLRDLESLQERLRDQRERALEADREAVAARADRELSAVGEQAEELRRLLPSVTETERKAAEQSQRLQRGVDDFRTRKEVLKARYVAAQAEQAVNEVLAAVGDPGGSDDPGRPSAGDSASAVDSAAGHPGTPGTPGAEDHEAPTATVADRLREITQEIAQVLRTEPTTDDTGDRRLAADLKELRPGALGAPADDVRIIFAAEPPGTALLIAVLEGHDAVQERYDEAVALSSEVLQRTRAGEAPEAAAHAYDDTESFLDEFFPGEASEVQAGAAALVARNRARTIAEQRIRLGLTQAQVAERMGVRQERVSAIERAEPGATEVRTLASYVDALGGRLEIIADFGGDRVVLR